MSNDKIIKFPGVRSTLSAPREAEAPTHAPNEGSGFTGSLADRELTNHCILVDNLTDAQIQVFKDSAAKFSNLTEDQQKAIRLIMDGMSFVFVGLKPTNGGADFFTALHGDEAELRAAEDALPAVIGRLYVKKGIR